MIAAQNKGAALLAEAHHCHVRMVGTKIDLGEAAEAAGVTGRIWTHEGGASVLCVPPAPRSKPPVPGDRTHAPLSTSPNPTTTPPFLSACSQPRRQPQRRLHA